MVPLSALTNSKSISGPEFTMRYNLYRSAQINATAAPGYSSGQAMKAMEEVFKETMPNEMGFAYFRHEFPGEAGAARVFRPAVIFAHLAALCFPSPRRAVRELDLPFSVLLGTRRSRCSAPSLH